MLDTTIGHIKSFFAENSTLVMSFEEAGQNVTKFFASVFENTSFLHTWNKTLQETINFVWKIQIQIYQKLFQNRHFFYRYGTPQSKKSWEPGNGAICFLRRSLEKARKCFFFLQIFPVHYVKALEKMMFTFLGPI